ncbi:hypothetical protein OPV22_000568 [Ensete ventricosum]|uniref:Uncharacterized protein n=1 Tax=Ensete ventricosum TaxID=4639 RepID=A0AAV8RUH3_ENSVE|nr:hypothetical protein OPV22_000568 [Ensete ventricosum]
MLRGCEFMDEASLSISCKAQASELFRSGEFQLRCIIYNLNDFISGQFLCVLHSNRLNQEATICSNIKAVFMLFRSGEFQLRCIIYNLNDFISGIVCFGTFQTIESISLRAAFKQVSDLTNSMESAAHKTEESESPIVDDNQIVVMFALCRCYTAENSEYKVIYAKSQTHLTRGNWTRERRGQVDGIGISLSPIHITIKKKKRKDNEIVPQRAKWRVINL